MAKSLKNPSEVKRAADYEEIRPLVVLCRAGKLFEVQEWIASSRPVNAPVQNSRRRSRTPLEVAVELGFHSLVKVLLEAGAVDDNGECEALIYDAIHRRRLDLIELFVANGFDAASVDMTAVLESWEPGIMQYFIEKGASLERGMPLARAFCDRIRTALIIYKTHRDAIPSLQEQANIALRYHCKEGNLKWVSLMLWAGADPYAPGSCDPDEEHSEGYEGLSALGFAALYRHYDVFGLKKIKLDPNRPQLRHLISYLSGEGGVELLLRLLKIGVNPNESDAEGCPAIQSYLNYLGWLLPSYWSFEREDGKIDTERDREGMKAIHLLAMHGAKWKPKDTRDINYVGFPIARIGALISLSCGAILNLGICRYAGKGQGEVSLLRQLWDVLCPGDVLLTDRLMANWTNIFLLQQRGIELVARLNKANRKADFRRGKRLGDHDHIVQWSKPSSIRSLDWSTYKTLPDSITIRETLVHVAQPGFRTKQIIVVTTLLDPAQTTKEDLAALYRERWNNELDLRSLKTTLQMHHLRCKSPDLVRKEVWTHALAYNLIRTVIAQAAATH